ncbi:hypothetical protein LguiA_007200 [Lonicera macranthoides]
MKSSISATIVSEEEDKINVKDVRALYELFKKLSSSLVNDGFISKIFSLFDYNNDGVIEFCEFVQSLSVFHPDAPQANKAAVKELILALLCESDLILSDDIVETIIDKTFEEADLKGHGKIDTDEWKDFVTRHPSLLKNMTIPYLKDLTTAFPSFMLKSELEDEIVTTIIEKN